MKDMTETQDVGITTAARVQAPVLFGFRDADLKIKDVMTDNVVCAVPDETVGSAIKRMSEHRVSCVVVVEDDIVVGILTERDVLRGVAADSRDPTRSKVAEKMSSPVVWVAPDVHVLEASEILRSKGIKRLVVGDGKRLFGLVTQTDITRGLTSLWPSKDAADIMSTDVVTVNVSVTVAQAARMMTSRNISCVVVTHRDEAVGIMTEKDILKRVVALHRDHGTTPVADVMSRPLVTSPPDHSILCIGRMMDRMRVHRLVVKENKQVCGIVSQTDILDALRRELEEIREAQWRHRSEASQLTDSIAENLSSIESLVREARGAPALSALTGVCANTPCGSLTSTRCGHHPATAGDPVLASLQDLISQSRSNLERISRMLRGGSLDGER
jgi:predicted transcriptional regulator